MIIKALNRGTSDMHKKWIGLMHIAGMICIKNNLFICT